MPRPKPSGDIGRAPAGSGDAARAGDRTASAADDHHHLAGQSTCVSSALFRRRLPGTRGIGLLHLSMMSARRCSLQTQLLPAAADADTPGAGKQKGHKASLGLNMRGGAEGTPWLRAEDAVDRARGAERRAQEVEAALRAVGQPGIPEWWLLWASTSMCQAARSLLQ